MQRRLGQRCSGIVTRAGVRDGRAQHEDKGDVVALTLTRGQGVGFVALVGVALIASGVLGLIARKKVSGAITFRYALSPGFRIASGVGMLLVFMVDVVAR